MGEMLKRISEYFFRGVDLDGGDYFFDLLPPDTGRFMVIVEVDSFRSVYHAGGFYSKILKKMQFAARS
jgi:hypothetical protein